MNARRLVGSLVVLLVVAGGVAYAVQQSSSGGDIFLEGAGATGANPFTTVAVSQCAEGYVAAPSTEGDQCIPVTTTSSSVVDTTSSLPGPTTTALYGGSGSQKRCDPEALIRYLTTHAEKAKAWVQGQNEDPTLAWSGGNKITVADIPAFIRELTPTFLTQDTRVTNHGYVNGRATPHQYVLQKGTAVLVDRNGVPRARCACGNPLGRPHKVRHPHYRGHCWEGCHDHPYCAPPGCADTTTSTSTSTSTSSSTSTSECVGKPSTEDLTGQDPCASSTTATTTKRKGKTTTTTAVKPSSTVTNAPTTPPTVPTTTSTSMPATTTSICRITTSGECGSTSTSTSTTNPKP